MSYETFIETVAGLGELDQDAAATAAEAVLGELAASLTMAQSQRTAGYLPGRLRKVVVRRSFESSMARFSPSTFISRVAEDEAVDDRTAAIHVKAVLETVERWLPVPVARLMYEELPGLWRELSGSIPPRPEEQTPQPAAE